jgi:hypothetical protein
MFKTFKKQQSAGSEGTLKKLIYSPWLKLGMGDEQLVLMAADCWS